MKAHLQTNHQEIYTRQLTNSVLNEQTSTKEVLIDVIDLSKLGITTIQTDDDSEFNIKNLMGFFDNLSESDFVKLREYINEVHIYNNEIRKQQEETKEKLLYCRLKLINSVESNRFYVYDSIDSASFNKRYILTLLTVRLDETKFTFNISIDSVFFDIKLYSNEDAFNHIMEFNPDSYEMMIRQPFDSTEKHNFL
ncbi:6892_t:CDS:2 [Cetraspora pellucida]|uniref:6892_t:CDS:1 n=1 Tax=Cetraspora pellucida TaxID=1433469 RepID=A0A9N8YX39_9GLOM|nr:6892_t:CDS:2 [Cetraspora pellucida]